MFKRLNAVHLSGTNVKRYLDLKYQDQSERMHVFQGRESKKYDKFTKIAWQAERNISFLDVSSLHQAKFQRVDDRFNVTTLWKEMGIWVLHVFLHQNMSLEADPIEIQLIETLSMSTL